MGAFRGVDAVVGWEELREAGLGGVCASSRGPAESSDSLSKEAGMGWGGRGEALLRQSQGEPEAEGPFRFCLHRRSLASHSLSEATPLHLFLLSETQPGVQSHPLLGSCLPSPACCPCFQPPAIKLLS